MPNTRSAAKQMRQTKKRQARNVAVKSELKTLIRRFRESVASGDQEDSLERLRRAQAKLDKAAKKGIIHVNTASRKKSRLQHHFNAAFLAESAEAVGDEEVEEEAVAA